MKKEIVFIFFMYLSIVVCSNQVNEQIFYLNEDLIKLEDHVGIKLVKFTVQENYYIVRIYFMNYNRGWTYKEKNFYKISFDINVIGTNNQKEYKCEKISSYSGKYLNEDGISDENLTDNHLFGDFDKEPFLLLTGSNTEENIYNQFIADIKIPRLAESVHFLGWFEDIKSNSKVQIDYTLKFTDYDSILKSTLSKVLFDIISPEIILISPEFENRLFRTDEFTTIIKGETTDNDGVFQVYVNNEIVSLESNGQFQKRIKLKIGKNPIEIKAIDINDNETTKEFLIIRDEIIEDDEFSDIDFAFETLNSKTNAIAVVFGIEEYQYAPNVSNAYNDAEIMREYLISTFGLKRKNIYFRYNERATKGEFEKVFSENGWIDKNADKNSEIYVFYAGHGVASTDSKSAYLIPNDIDPNYASTGYSLNELYQNLSKIESKSTTIILDACFSGISRENEMLLADSRPVSIKVKQGSIPKNLNVFTASSGSEISSGYSQKLHGLFTYFFLKGLNKNADSNNDNKITYGEMENYLKENVSSQAKKMGREQNPQLHTNDKDKVLLRY